MQESLANPTRVDYRWPLLFLAYFSLQILLRTAIGRGLGIDEAELMLTARTLEWGYGAQPPLYSWIQHGLFALFGETIFALALLKNSFLCLTYLALFSLLRSHYDREVAGAGDALPAAAATDWLGKSAGAISFRPCDSHGQHNIAAIFPIACNPESMVLFSFWCCCRSRYSFQVQLYYSTRCDVDCSHFSAFHPGSNFKSTDFVVIGGNNCKHSDAHPLDYNQPD